MGLYAGAKLLQTREALQSQLLAGIADKEAAAVPKTQRKRSWYGSVCRLPGNRIKTGRTRSVFFSDMKQVVAQQEQPA
jgi:hypothetical protein